MPSRSTRQPTEAMMRQLIVSIDRQTQSFSHLAEAIGELAASNNELLDRLNGIVEDAEGKEPAAVSLDQRVEDLLNKQRTF